MVTNGSDDLVVRAIDSLASRLMSLALDWRLLLRIYVGPAKVNEVRFPRVSGNHFLGLSALHRRASSVDA